MFSLCLPRKTPCFSLFTPDYSDVFLTCKIQIDYDDIKSNRKRPKSDGLYTVYIRVTHARKSVYINTNKVVDAAHISDRGEPTDPVVKEYCSRLVREYMDRKMEAFHKDAALQAEKGNKAAGQRARCVSLELEPLLKQFRKLSLAASKK